MAFCANCGANVEGRFCAKCGSAVGEPAPAGFNAAPPPPGAQPYSGSAQAGGLTENAASALAYLAGVITGVIFLALAPYNQNRNIRFHAWQSIAFNAAMIVFWIVLMILSMVMPWFVSAFLAIASIVLWLCFLVVWVLLMVKAYGNQRWKLPIVGDFAEKQAG